MEKINKSQKDVENEIFKNELKINVDTYLNKYNRDDYNEESRVKIVDALFRLKLLDDVQETDERYTPETYVLGYFERSEKKPLVKNY